MIIITDRCSIPVDLVVLLTAILMLEMCTQGHVWHYDAFVLLQITAAVITGKSVCAAALEHLALNKCRNQMLFAVTEIYKKYGLFIYMGFA